MTTYKLPFQKVKRKVLVKQESKGTVGISPEKRETKDIIDYGVVNINKPAGPTSHQVSEYVQKILGLKKAGHSGTLDPAVHGCLPIALGRATKVVQTLLSSGKEYVGVMHLHKELSGKKVQQTINKHFIGIIKQLPPIKSAVKRQEREREIYYFKILEQDEKDFVFIVGCQAGTYIRKLCLHPNTEIVTSELLTSAKDFFYNPKPVFSMVNKKITQQTPSESQKFRFTGKLLKIEMDSGISFQVTPEHRMLISTENGYMMKQARNLSSNDYIVKSCQYPVDEVEISISDLLDDRYLVDQISIKNSVKRAFIKKYGSIRGMYRALKLDRKPFLKNSKHSIPLGHIKKSEIFHQIKNKIFSFKTEKGTKAVLKGLNPDLLYLAGLVASDGNNTKEKGTIRYTRLKFHNKEQALIKQFERKYRKLFPNFNLTQSTMPNGVTQLDTSNSFLATIFANLGIKSPQKYSDLSSILLLKKNLIASFLKGYFDGDGTTYFKKKTTKKGYYTRIDFLTVSENDAVVLHKLLLKLGILNKILLNGLIYVIVINDPKSKKLFCTKIGSNHPRKKENLRKIRKLYAKEQSDSFHIGFHFKYSIKKNKKKLHKMGGNLTRVLSSKVPITKSFYQKASNFCDLPSLDDFKIEKIRSIEEVKYDGFVYDMTVPDTHNFLIETGFVSSNCHDLGDKLGVGAHMAELRRTKAGPFDESTLFTLQDLADAFHYYKEEGNDKLIRKIIQPVEKAVEHLPKVWVFDQVVSTLKNGAYLHVPGISQLHEGIEKDDMVAVMSLKGELISLGTAYISSKEMMKRKKGLAVTTDRVFV